MRLPDQLRADMLDVIKVDLESLPSMKIKFYNDSSILLAEIEFSEIDLEIAEQTYLRPKRLITSTDSDLIGTVSASGVVSNFIIPMNSYGDITGSVGAIGSQSDIKFNNLSWAINAIIRIPDLKIIIEQGT